MAPYTLILVAVSILSPFAITLAQKQDKKTKSRLKHIFLLLLIGQVSLGLLNWNALWLFLIISLLQIFLLIRKTPAETPIVVLNFINTFVFFLTMIRLDQRQISDSTNLTGIAIVFVILIGNVIGLLLINKEKKLRPIKPLSRRGKLIFSLILAGSMAIILGLSYWNKGTRDAVIARISALPEVKEYLRTVPSGLVVIDHDDKDTNSYLIHVYEIKNGHTATFNWYVVNKATGEIKAEKF